MRLLLLSAYVQKNLVENKITQGHAKILVGLDESRQKVIVDTIVGQKLSVRDTESLVKNRKNSTKTDKIISRQSINLDLKSKRIIDEKLPFNYKIKHNSIEIMLPNEEELIKFISFIANR
jgi:ParB family chromosome partitioning protein